MRLPTVFSLLLLTCFTVSSQSVLNIPKLVGTVKLDGLPDEEVWTSVNPFPLVMQTPVFGKEPSENTDIRMFFNEKYLYVGAKMYYSDISLISKHGKQRDYLSGSCDWFGVFFDSFDDNENMVAFFTNPNGLRFDATVKNDAAMGFEDVNLSWNTFWDVAAKIDKNGWYAEFRIPVSSLRFQVVNDTVRMGLSLFRYIPTKNESQTFPAIDPKYGDMASWKPSLAAPIQFAGIEPDNPVYITPYLIGGIERLNSLNESETSYNTELIPKYNIGGDAKIGLSNNMTLDLTINTDFAQVEADDQQINLTRFSLFFPEKRPFFLEKSDVFNFDLIGGNNLFYSRRIGLYDGQSVPIIGGARITGRIGSWDVGILDMQTASIDDLNSENFGVIRTKKSLFNANSYVGSMLTSRMGTDGSYNIAYGIDGVFKVVNDEYLTIRWAQTFQDGALNSFVSEDPSRLLVRWENRTLKGLSYDLLYTWSGKDFNPGIGFEMIDDYYAARGSVKYGWLPENETSKLRTHNISQSTLALYNSIDHTLQSFNTVTTWEYSTRSGYSGNFLIRYNREIVNDSLSFNDSDVPPGDYNFWDAGALIVLKPGANPGATIMIQAGQFFDGTRISLNLMPSWSVNPSLDINPTYRFDRVDFKDRDQNFTNHILGLKALWMISTKLSITSFIQYNTSIESWLVNARFRYNPREGNDFYIVYNEGLNTNLYRESPTLPRSESRVLMVKYTYTFGF